MVLSEAEINEITSTITDELRKTFEAQGHKMTGALIDNLEYVSKETSNEIIIQLLMAMYGVYLDTGVSAAKIPFSPPSGRGGKSKYIQALISYAEKRMGLSGREAKSAAFAIAMKQKKEGMPTRASSRFSRTGERTQFFSRTIKEKESLIESQLRKTLEKIFIGRIENKITGMVKTFNSKD
jgi:hypothetical protein